MCYLIVHACECRRHGMKLSRLHILSNFCKWLCDVQQRKIVLPQKIVLPRNVVFSRKMTTAVTGETVKAKIRAIQVQFEVKNDDSIVHARRRFVAASSVISRFGDVGIKTPKALAYDTRTSRLYVACEEHIMCVAPSGKLITDFVLWVRDCSGLCLVDDFLYYVSGHSIWSYELRTTAQILVAGSVADEDYRNGCGPDARFASPCGIAADHTGNIIVCDPGNRCVRTLDPRTER
jgi:hypothetical protein